MKQTVNFSQFVDGFSNRKENFSYDGLRALYDYLEQLEDDMGTEIEFDPIAICCEYSEYEDLEDLQKDYNDIESLEDLENHTQVIYVHGGRLIVQQF